MVYIIVWFCVYSILSISLIGTDKSSYFFNQNGSSYKNLNFCRLLLWELYVIVISNKLYTCQVVYLIKKTLTHGRKEKMQLRLL